MLRLAMLLLVLGSVTLVVTTDAKVNEPALVGWTVRMKFSEGVARQGAQVENDVAALDAGRRA